jgi:hypothetical protein
MLGLCGTCSARQESELHWLYVRSAPSTSPTTSPEPVNDGVCFAVFEALAEAPNAVVGDGYALWQDVVDTVLITLMTVARPVDRNRD